MDEEDRLPPLPKRPPTVIRAAPPPPAVKQNGHRQSQSIPSRPAPPRPVPKPPTPTVFNASAKPAPTQEVSNYGNGQSSADKSSSNNNTSTRRKLEITIVDARPMSEMGFRDMKSPLSTTQAKPNSSISQESGNIGDKEEPVSVISPPPRPSRPTENVGDKEESIVKPPPPRPSRPTENVGDKEESIVKPPPPRPSRPTENVGDKEEPIVKPPPFRPSIPTESIGDKEGAIVKPPPRPSRPAENVGDKEESIVKPPPPRPSRPTENIGDKEESIVKPPPFRPSIPTESIGDKEGAIVKPPPRPSRPTENVGDKEEAFVKPPPPRPSRPTENIGDKEESIVKPPPFRPSIPTESIGDKEESIVKPLPPRPSRPSAMPIPSPFLPQDSVSSQGETPGGIGVPVKDGSAPCGEDKVTEPPAEERNDSGEAVVTRKPKRPTIIRPQSKLMKQQAVTSEDSQADPEEKKPPPPLPSLPPCPDSKVPPLPSRPPVAPTPTSPPPVSRPPLPKPQPLNQAPPPLSRPPPPKIESQPPPVHEEIAVVPRPKPRPRVRPKSTIAVTSSPLSEFSSTVEGTNINIDSTSSSISDNVDNVEPQTKVDRPPNRKRPTIIRPQSVILTSSSQSLSIENSSQDGVSLAPSQSAPVRPQPPAPSGHRKLPLRPSAPPAKEQSLTSPSNFEDGNVYETIDDVKESRQSKPHLEENLAKDEPSITPPNSDIEDKNAQLTSLKSSTKKSDPNFEVPQYSRIKKPLNSSLNLDSNKSPFSVKLKSTLPSENKEVPSESNMEEPPPIPPKVAAKPKPPGIKPKPKPKPSGINPNKDSNHESGVESLHAEKHIESEGEMKIESKMGSNAGLTPEEQLEHHQVTGKLHVLKSVSVTKEVGLVAEEAKSKEERKGREPHHISAAFLSKFEPRKTDSESKMEDTKVFTNQEESIKETPDNVEMRTPQLPHVSSSRALPPAPSKRPVTIIGRQWIKEKDENLTDNVNRMASSVDDMSVSLRESAKKSPSAPKRPVTIIGVPRRPSKAADSVDKESDCVENVEDQKLTSENAEVVSPEKIIQGKPSRPPQISRPPPPVHRSPLDGNTGSAATIENVQEAASDSATDSRFVIEEDEEPVHNRPRRPTGPPLPVPPPPS